MSNSPNLSLPLIQPAQAQKHVTHNEALKRLDALVQLSVEALDATAPPAAPVEGRVFGVAPGATGDFDGQSGKLACFSNGGWLHLSPREGMRAWDKATGALHVHDGSRWIVLDAVGAGDDGGPVDLNGVDGVGINADYDAANRLAVASSATLLSHDGAITA